MKRMIALLGGGLLAASLNVGVFAQNSEEAKPVTITGELIDTACYVASDGDAKGKGHAECAQKCMASGVPAGILPEGKQGAEMMYLLTNPTVLAPYAGQTIQVEGTSHPDMKAIDVKKLSVKDGENWKEVQLKDEHHKMSGGETKDDGHKDHKH